MPDGAKYVLALAMLAGRVELLALLSLLNPAYWRR
jgi:Trk-type K+ transport system membrane component